MSIYVSSQTCKRVRPLILCVFLEIRDPKKGWGLFLLMVNIGIPYFEKTPNLKYPSFECWMIWGGPLIFWETPTTLSDGPGPSPTPFFLRQQGTMMEDLGFRRMRRADAHTLNEGAACNKYRETAWNGIAWLLCFLPYNAIIMMCSKYGS